MCKCNSLLTRLCSVFSTHRRAVSRHGWEETNSSQWNQPLISSAGTFGTLCESFRISTDEGGGFPEEAVWLTGGLQRGIRAEERRPRGAKHTARVLITSTPADLFGGVHSKSSDFWLIYVHVYCIQEQIITSDTSTDQEIVLQSTYNHNNLDHRGQMQSTIIEAKLLILHSNQEIRMSSGSVRNFVFSSRMNTGNNPSSDWMEQSLYATHYWRKFSDILWFYFWFKCNQINNSRSQNYWKSFKWDRFFNFAHHRTKHVHSSCFHASLIMLQQFNSSCISSRMENE